MIKVEELTKHYGPVTAVDHVSFTVRPGMVTGFLGPNGAGKSTTMRMILGLDRPSDGRVRINGKALREWPSPLRTLGAMLDANAADPGRTARHHLLWLAHSNGIPQHRIDHVLGLVGLTSAADRRIGGFSLGMRQRLGIAGALLGDPEVVMFDEPINGLDPDGILWLRSFMRELATQGRTVFVSSHLMGEVAHTADHVIVIGRGRIIADASVHEVLTTHASSSVRVKSEQQSDLAQELLRLGAMVEPDDDGALSVKGLDSNQIGGIAAARGLALMELVPRQPSLEDAFFELTHDATEYATAAG
jgi:ABC-2 type transport system ATP-binding protein